MTWNEHLWDKLGEDGVTALARSVQAEYVGTFRRFDTHGGDSKLNQHTGRTVEVVRALSDDECDLLETGPMFEVRLTDGTTFQAYADEIEEKRAA